MNGVDDDKAGSIRFANSSVVRLCAERFEERFGHEVERFDEMCGTNAGKCINELTVALGLPGTPDARSLVDGKPPLYQETMAKQGKALFAALAADGYEPKGDGEAELFRLMEEMEVE